MSARLKLTLSYAGFLLIAGTILLAAVALFLLRYVPESTIGVPAGVSDGRPSAFIPDRSDLTKAFVPAATAATLFLLVLGLVGGWLLAGRMLAPLRRIGDAAKCAAEGSLSHRVALHKRTDEFGELADTFDSMLERLEADVGRQQRFAANASHELRTPLATSKALLDVARNDASRDIHQLIDRLEVVNSRAIDLTEALLLLARGEAQSFTPESVDLSLLAEEATETLLANAEEREIDLEVTAERVIVAGSKALLLQLTTNLLHNAIVHNVASGGRIVVYTGAERGVAIVRVENTGDPISPEVVATLTEPFVRGSGRARDERHAGVGLGLAIVESIARAHDGSLSLRPRSGGGLVATLELPVRPGG